MIKRKKGKNKKISPKIALGLFLTIIPLLLFINGIIVEVRGETNEYGNSDLVESLNNYYFCESTDSEAQIEEIKIGLMPEAISIKSIDLALPVILSPLVNNTWEVKNNVANYAQGTSLIDTNNGNIGIYGHDKDNIFGLIKNISVGDEIFLFSGKFKAIYTVEESFVSNPERVDVFSPTDEPSLTLVTCDGIFSDQRYVVRAKLNKIEEVNCND